MNALHPTPRALEKFVLGKLGPVEMREIARHLLSGCPLCQDVTSMLWEPVDRLAELRPDEIEGGYDTVLDRVFARVLASEALIADQQSLSLQLYQELLRCPAERRHLLVTNSRRFHNRMLCERLIEGSYEAGFEDPRHAIEIARLAVLAADQLTVEECGGSEGLAGLRIRAWAYLGNACRIHVDLASSEAAFVKVESMLSEEEVPLAEKARVLSFLASWRKEQQRFGEASQILDRVAAIYRKLGQWNFLGRTLLQKATVCGEAGDGEGEMALLRRALDLIDPQADPRIFLAARHNLINGLYESGRVREAFALLYHTRPLYLQAGDRVNLVKLRWLEGVIAFGLKRIDQAEAAFREVRASFQDLGLDYDAALAALDLAGVYILQGRSADVSRIAEETLATFQSYNTHREGVAALLVFSNAARMNQAGLDLVRQVSGLLKKTRQRSALRAPKPS
jgi:tetratricopeptide (TPR) repeat protein